MTILSTLVAIVIGWAVLFVLSLPVLAALVRSSQLSRDNENTNLDATSVDASYSASRQSAASNSQPGLVIFT